MADVASNKLSPDELGEQLSRIAGDLPITYCPNRGNAGDGTICSATWRLFDRFELTSQVSTRVRGGPGVFIFGGGGNLVPLYRDGADLLREALADSYEHIVILPHTLRANQELLSLFDQRVHVFCRDIPSLDLVHAHARNAHIYLADDLALTLDVEAALHPSWSHFSPASLAIRAPLLLTSRRRKRLRGWLRDTPRIHPEAGVLRLMRADQESIFSDATARSQDLSGLYLSKFKSRVEAEWITRDFLRVLSRASAVETDRLHVAIGASLLGKPVRMYNNSYGKNRAVYELSLRDRFPDLEWLDSAKINAC